MTSTKNFADVLKKKLAKDPGLADRVELECEHSHLATLIYEKRKEKGLTQAQLGDLVGTSQTVIARLEAADYDGHSFSMVRRIAKALDCFVRVEMYPRPLVEFSQSYSWDASTADLARIEPEWLPEIKTDFYVHVKS